MQFSVVRDQKEIACAFDTMASNWKNKSEDLTRNISWKGKSQEPELRNNKKFPISWRPEDHVWGYFQRDYLYDREKEKYQHMFFAGFSLNRDPLDIDSQFVMPVKDWSSRFGGVFLKDERENTYLGHSFRIGGGKVEGFTRDAFLSYCETKLKKGFTDATVCIIEIGWPEPRGSLSVLCIANITSPQLPQRVRKFTELRLGCRNALDSRRFKQAFGEATDSGG